MGPFPPAVRSIARTAAAGEGSLIGNPRNRGEESVATNGLPRRDCGINRAHQQPGVLMAGVYLEAFRGGVRIWLPSRSELRTDRDWRIESSGLILIPADPLGR